jgi:hypothetical protein
MNERIEQLAEQARQYANSMYPSGLDMPKWGPAFHEKFAELIVRECATKANAVAIDLRNDPNLNARKYVGDSIIKCFGVE